MGDHEDPSKEREASHHASGRLVCSIGGEETDLTREELKQHISSFLSSLGPRDDVLLIPPDFTRYHSQAGLITQLICQHYGFIKGDGSSSSTFKAESQVEPDSKKQKQDSSTDREEAPPSVPPSIQILPALGTHAPMTPTEIRTMYGDELANRHEADKDLFLVHEWRRDVVTIGHVPAEMVSRATHGLVNDKTWPAQLNRTVWEKRKSLYRESTSSSGAPPLVVSIGQVVPHEVMGMANFNKNLFVGCGGVEAINLSHFIGAVHGMEQMMGQASNPLRDILNHASENFLQSELDLWYVLTVVSPHTTNPNRLCIRGLYIGNDIRCYQAACELSLKVNFTLLDRPVARMVTYLDPDEFHSTWLGNKAIYRTRMAMADGGSLIVLGPGIAKFGEDGRVDELIRKYGYKGTPSTMQSMRENVELQENLSAVAHLIHGSAEGRFHVTYCPGHLSRDEIEAVGFDFEDFNVMIERYKVSDLRDGWNTDDDGDFYFIRNPALGLWAVPSRFGSREAL
jgi:nickel-dependent lactate racemase